MTGMYKSFAGLIERYAALFSELVTMHTREGFAYVSDTETYEMLYMSLDDPDSVGFLTAEEVGGKCYGILQGRDSPCPFCTNGKLSREQYLIWQYYNPRSQTEYLLKDKLIDWNGKVARMEIAMDISSPQRKSRVLMETLESNGLLLQCNNILNESKSVNDALKEIIKRACDFFDADSGFCIMYDGTGIQASWSESGGPIIPNMLMAPPVEAIRGWRKAFGNKHKLMINDVSKISGYEDIKSEYARFGVDSLMAIPLIGEDKIEGFFCINNIKSRYAYLSSVDMIVQLIGRRIKDEAFLKIRMQLQYRDPLTGYYNFEGFKVKAQEYLNSENGRKYAIMYLDIKHFSYINEAFGYEAGDTLLKYWSGRINERLREGESFGRISSDVFVILRWYETTEDIYSVFAANNDDLKRFVKKIGMNIVIERAAGVYLIREKEIYTDISQLIDRASMAQKSVKNQPGNTIAEYSSSIQEKNSRRMIILDGLEQALAEEQIYVCYQPQIDYLTNEITGAEALARWKHPRLGEIYPGEFIPILENRGRIFELDRYICQNVLAEIKRWNKEGYRVIPISINLSRKDIYAPNIFEELETAIENMELKKSWLNLEITESAYLENPEQLIESVNRFRSMGFCVEMDDFGSGYSSLNLLKNVCVDVLKLDREFVKDVERKERGRQIISSVVKMAKSLGMSVVAEGVETRAQAECLKKMGCTCMQGFYFSKPIPAEEFEKLLKNGGLLKM